MLRDYQTEMISKLRKSWAAGHRKPCLVAPCGAGKTIISAEMAKRATDAGNSVLFLVHRKELVEQTQKAFDNYGVDPFLCKVGMIQTLSRKLDYEPKLIIIDENHHCYAKSYLKLMDKCKNSYFIGLTATPQRLNGDGLGKVNDDLILGPTVEYLIENSFLSPFKYFSHVSADTSKLQVQKGEFIASQVDNLMSQDYIYGNAVKNYMDYGLDKTIVYSSSIKNSEAVAETFRNTGINAAHIDGETPKKQRSEIIQAFRDGYIKVLCNVDLISEGFDVPDCDSCILLRPTMSLTLHIQQSMRCMRFKEGKTATIIDQVENFKRHGLPDTPREWTLEYKNRKDKSKAKVKECDNCHSVWNVSVLVCKKCGWDMRLAICGKCELEQQYGFGECADCGEELIRRDRSREKEIIEDAMLEEIKSFKFKDWHTAKDAEELKKIQEARGYRPGWVYYKSKELGFI